MDAQPIRVLTIEDNPADVELIREALAEVPDVVFLLQAADRLSTGVDILGRGGIDAVLLDLSLPDCQGLDTFRRLRARAADVPVVVLSGLTDETLAVQAVQEGAQDYLVKGRVPGAALARSLRHALERQRAQVALRDQTRILQSILHSIADGVVVADEQGCFLHWNLAAAQILGMGPVDVSPEQWSEHYGLYLPDTVTLYSAHELPLARAQRGQVVNEAEVFVRNRKAPTGMWLSVNARPLTDESGNLRGGVVVFRDITAHKRAAQALQESEHRYRRLLGSVTDYIYTVTREKGRAVATAHGPGCAAVTGYRAEEYEADPLLWYRMIHAADRPAVEEQAAQLHAGQAAVPLEHRIIHKDGSIRWVSNTPVLRYDEHGGVRSYDGLVADITERKQVEEALKDERNLLRTLIDNLADSIFITDAEHRFIINNQAHLHFLNVASQAEVVGKTDFDFLVRERAARSQTDAQAVMRTGQSVLNREELVVDEAGNRRWLSTTTIFLPNGREQSPKLLSINRDITDHKRMAEYEGKMQVARAIQQKLFPLAPPRLAGLDIGGASYPAEATGGDYFDYIALPGGELGIVVGDVSGHGFGSALLMAETRACLRAFAQTAGGDVSQILARANRMLAADTQEERFITLLFALLDPQQRTLVYSSAGHDPGYVLDAGGCVKARLESTDLPLGLMAESRFPTAAEVRLAPGDLVLLLSDGILEARSPKGTSFGATRALDVVRVTRGQPAREIVDALFQAVRGFTHPAAPTDDVTAVVLKVEPQASIEPVATGCYYV
jgi:sigma-B regulation protein RsbU (phosphoserine phosphatase)